MMAQDRAESTWVTISYGDYITQFSSDTVKSMQQLKRTYAKICRQKMSVQWNIYIYIYIYICVCVCVCVCAWEREGKTLVRNDGLVWFLCLMAYQLFLGYLMPKPFS